MTSNERETIKELIKRRRMQIRLHACIYYIFNESIIDDQTYDRWVQELIGLQTTFPKLSENVEMYDLFKTFTCVEDAINLDLGDADLQARAQHIIKTHVGK